MSYHWDTAAALSDLSPHVKVLWLFWQIIFHVNTQGDCMLLGASLWSNIEPCLYYMRSATIVSRISACMKKAASFSCSTWDHILCIAPTQKYWLAGHLPSIVWLVRTLCVFMWTNGWTKTLISLHLLHRGQFLSTEEIERRRWWFFMGVLTEVLRLGWAAQGHVPASSIGNGDSLFQTNYNTVIEWL